MSIKAAVIAGAFAAVSVAAQDKPDAAESESVVVSSSPVTEETLIGGNQQPAWTAYRRFATTRIYVYRPGSLSSSNGGKGNFRMWGNRSICFSQKSKLVCRIVFNSMSTKMLRTPRKTQHDMPEIKSKPAGL